METPDVPDRPLTIAEHHGNKLLADGAYEIQMGGKRRVLSADELYEMEDLRPRFEKELRLPLDSRGATSRVYMFSVDGRLRGEALIGCLFAGECMLIQADTFEKALNIAKDGLQTTLEAVREEFERRTSPIEVVSANDPINAGITAEAAGRKGAETPGGALRTDPLLKAMIGTIIGGKKRDW